MDVRALLPSVRVPSLVVQYSDDALIIPAMGKYVADHLPESKYVELPGRNAYHFVEPWRDSFQEIAEFLTGHQPEVADDRVLATVLFTDIVGSTRRASELGDSNWRALLDAHDAVVRAQLSRFRGREVNTSATVSSRRSTGHSERRRAMAIRDAVQPLGIEVRAGSAHGEWDLRGDDIGGIAVHIGARVSALAGPNDVLVSSTLRDLVIGSGLEFDDRGTHQLRSPPMAPLCGRPLARLLGGAGTFLRQRVGPCLISLGRRVESVFDRQVLIRLLRVKWSHIDDFAPWQTPLR